MIPNQNKDGGQHIISTGTTEAAKLFFIQIIKEHSGDSETIIRIALRVFERSSGFF